MTDFERQRLTMVESQLRPNKVTDPRLLAAMRTLPRERFVPNRLRALAYMDETVEVFPSIDGAPARFLLAPMVLARLVQLAAVQPQDAVLDPWSRLSASRTRWRWRRARRRTATRVSPGSTGSEW